MITLIYPAGTATVSKKTLRKIIAQERYEEARKATEEAHQRRIDWLWNPENFDDPIWSDLWKDEYGVRPRGIWL